MARLSRYVIPGQPQHVIQRGNNRQVIFVAEADYQFFRDAIVEAAGRFGLAIRAYVWMTNHLHLLQRRPTKTASAKPFSRQDGGTSNISITRIGARVRCGKAATGQRSSIASAIC